MVVDGGLTAVYWRWFILHFPRRQDVEDQLVGFDMGVAAAMKTLRMK